MKTAILITPEMRPVPLGVSVNNFGPTTVVSDVNGHRSYYIGDHAIIEGDDEVIKNWLRPFDGVYIGVGHPMMEQFEIMHIR